MRLSTNRWVREAVRVRVCAVLATLVCLASQGQALGSPPDPPTNASPLDGSQDVRANPVLCARVSDPEGDPVEVRFYGRELTAAPAPDFSLVVLPDTQLYSRIFPQIFDSQTGWIVDERETRSIAFVTQVGDCVDKGDSAFEWANADAAMGLLEDPLETRLEDGIPYGIAVGNHDNSASAGTIDDEGATTALYNETFGISRFDGREYYGGHYGINNDNHYELFSASGMDFVIVHLEFDSVDGELRAAVLDWADGVLKAHPDRRAIISSHYLLDADGTFGEQGQATYDALKNNPNLFLMLCGHQWANPRRTDTHEGNEIHTLMSNYQWLENGGNGWLRILRFSPQLDAIEVETYSPWLDEFMTDSVNQFTLEYDMEAGLPFQAIGPASPFPSGSMACTSWPGRRLDAEYEWYVTVSQGESTVAGPRWTFSSNGSCGSSEDCDAGDPCALGTCLAGQCAAVPLPNCCVTDEDCSDSNPCTDEVCHEGSCEVTENSDPCSDADPCTVNDLCDSGICAGVSLDCDDSNECTADSCEDGECRNDYAPQPGCCSTPGDCDDADPCSTEACMPGGQCANFTGPDCCSGSGECDDGDSCTRDSCSGNNSAVAFDGQGSHVTMGAAPGLDAREFTLECWFKWDGGGEPTSTYGTTDDFGGIDAYPLVTKGWLQSDTEPEKHINYFLGIHEDGHVLAADFEEHHDGPDGGLNHPVVGSTPVSLDVWHHAAVTYDGCCWQLYLDGQPETAGDNCPGRVPNFDNAHHFALGTAIRTSFSMDGSISGLMDEVRVWGRALAPEEIQANMNLPVEYHPDLLGRWGFDEGAGYAAVDSTGRGNDGALVLAEWVESDLPTHDTGSCSAAEVPVCCSDLVDCDDGNPCTIDDCVNGSCETMYVPFEGCCAGDVDCTDADPCTQDLCSPAGDCSNPPLDTDGDGMPDCMDPDDDDDLAPDCQDCAPTLPEEWAPAGEVSGVLLQGSAPTVLTWTETAPVYVYDVAGGLLSGLFEAGGAEDAECLLDDGPETSHVDPRPDPGSSEGYYYLIRADGACPGSYGSGSSGADRLPAGPCP